MGERGVAQLAGRYFSMQNRHMGETARMLPYGDLMFGALRDSNELGGQKWHNQQL
jgi:hypothetical protein